MGNDTTEIKDKINEVVKIARSLKQENIKLKEEIRELRSKEIVKPSGKDDFEGKNLHEKLLKSLDHYISELEECIEKLDERA